MKYLKKHYKVCVYAIFAVFYFWLAAQIPYTHDDWDWGLPVGLQQLLTANLNGRYVGNFFEVVMTRSEILKTVIIGGGFCLLPIIIAAIAFHRAEDSLQKDRTVGFILCNVLLLSMDRSVWQQTYGWIAGYANFGLSSVFLMLVMWKFLRVFDTTPSAPPSSVPRSAALFLICLAGQLFIENISIFVFLCSIVINLIYWHKTKRFSCDYVLMFLASLIGLAIIFSSSIYETLWATGELHVASRHLNINAQTDLQTVVSKCMYQILRMPYNIYARNISVCVAITVLMSLLLVRHSFSRPHLRTVLLIGNGVLTVCFLLSPFAGFVINSLSSGIFFLVVTTELFLLFRGEKALLYKLFFIWLSPIGVILPLTFTSDLGPRLFFTSSALLILFALYLLRFCLKSMPKKVYCSAFICVLACVLLLQCGTVYFEIGKCSRQRTAIIENAVKAQADTIYLPRYPYSDYLWKPDPFNPEREAFFKDFYNIPQTVSIVFVD